MGDVFVLSCLLLVYSTLAVGETGESSTKARDDGIGAVVAHLVEQQSSVNAKLQALETSLRATETALAASNRELGVTKKQLAATDTKLLVTQSEMKATMTKRQTRSQGSSFVRWGRKSCPRNTIRVYVGIAGGKWYGNKGSGTNPLCLSRTPQFDYTAKPAYYGTLYGAEYDWIPGHHNHDVPCSVCLAPQSTTIMVPGTLTCPSGWTPQYTGHLASQWKDLYASEYVCLDGSPQDDSSGVRNDNALVFNYVVAVCGSLPCPPYINNRVVTCVVCSK